MTKHSATAAVEILRRLVAFPTVSCSSNLELAHYVRGLVEPLGGLVERAGGTGDRENLWITIGPRDRPGVLLSGHSDVVPISGQDWTRPPFTLTEEGGRLYGRGTADMKGFLAVALACAIRAASRPLQTPLHIAISFDEEIGCVGVRSLLTMLAERENRPLLCIIGEPTSMRIALGHKGKVALRATCIGREAHSALAPDGLNAIHLASEFIAGLRDLQREVASRAVDADYDVPYSTIHVGMIRGGEALNIVPARCTLDLEFRNIGADDPATIEASIRLLADRVAARHRNRFAEAEIALDVVNAYPGLNTRNEVALGFIAGLSGSNEAPFKVAFGTEGGLFSEQLAVPTIICGPGSMAQGHKPDEFITLDQIERCEAMLDRLLDRLEETGERMFENAH